MDSWTLVFENSAIKDITKLAPTISKRIGLKIKWFISQPDPLNFATKLVGNGIIGDYRFRVGDYRVLFDTDESKQIIVRIVMHRREVYRSK
jgi:mRNA interferase RelE/StbE